MYCKYASYFCYLATLVAFSSCKFNHRTSDVKDSESGPSILYILNGGYGSCPSEAAPSRVLYQPLKPNAEPITTDEDRADYCQTDAKIKAVMETFANLDQGGTNGADTACDGKAKRFNPQKMPLFTKYFFPFVTSQSPVNTRIEWIATCYPGGDNSVDDPESAQGEVHLYLSKSDDPDNVYQTSRAQYWKYLAARAKNASEIYLVGHSHGAWTALQTLLHTSIRGQSKTGLVTLDALSVPRCNFKSFVASAASPQIEDCLRFPSDVDGSKVKAGVNWWLNYFVTDGALHSGFTDQATNGNTLDQQVNAASHTNIADQERVWAQVQAKLKFGH